MPENTPGSRENNPNPVVDQATPHSGVNGYERPVYNFDGQNLQEALDSGALHIEYDEAGKAKVVVPDTIGDHIDPTKSTPTEAHVPLVAPEKAEKKSKRRLAIGSVIGSALLAGGTILGVNALSNDTPKQERVVATPNNDSETDEPSAEPSSATGESEAPNPEQQQSTESVVGVANTTLEGANVILPLEVAEQAAQPILVSEHNPIQAAELWTDYYNAYLLSQQANPDGSTGQTPESAELQQRVEENLWGPVSFQQQQNIDLSEYREFRENVSKGMFYMNFDSEDFPFDPNNAGTYHLEHEILESIGLGVDTYLIQLEVTATSNMAEKDPEHWSAIEPERTLRQDLTLKVVDGHYVAVGMKAVS